jgi:hypothetical protein
MHGVTSIKRRMAIGKDIPIGLRQAVCERVGVRNTLDSEQACARLVAGRRLKVSRHGMTPNAKGLPGQSYHRSNCNRPSG